MASDSASSLPIHDRCMKVREAASERVSRHTLNGGLMMA